MLRLEVITVGIVASLCLAPLGCSGDDRGPGNQPGAPELVDAWPADGEEDVSVLALPAVTFDEGIDVTDATLELRAWGQTGPVPVVVAAEGDTVRIQPFEPLAYGTLHTLTMVEVADGRGRTAAPVTTSFRTAMNPPAVQIQYGAYNGGLVQHLTTHRSDDRGVVVGTEFYGDPGPDGDWLTADDPISSYTVNVLEGYVRVGRLSTHDPGNDQQWHTRDDDVTYYAKYAFSELGIEVLNHSHSDPGPDQAFDTADDVFQYVDYAELDEQGRPVRRVRVWAGNDGAYQTDDDTVDAYTDLEYDGSGRRISSVYGYGPGADAAWFTDDDVIQGQSTHSYDDDGRPNGMTNGMPGPDLVPFTDDDDIEYTEYQYDDEGRLSAQVNVDDFGVVQHYKRFDRNAAGLVLRETTFAAPGLDGQFLSDDDVPSYYTEASYDDDGNRRRTSSHPNAGPDGIWFTGDDGPGYETHYATE